MARDDKGTPMFNEQNRNVLGTNKLKDFNLDFRTEGVTTTWTKVMEFLDMTATAVALINDVVEYTWQSESSSRQPKREKHSFA